jgi:hypothetical protein
MRTSVDTDLSTVPDLSGTTMSDPDIGTGLTAAEASLSSGSFEDQAT